MYIRHELSTSNGDLTTSVVSMLDSSAADSGFEPRSGHTKDYEISICYFSAKNAALSKNKD
jgi:hypothetical protein